MNPSIYPLSFFLSAIALILCSIYAWKHRWDGWGLPMLAVLGTVAVWYHGDGIYNDYEMYRLKMGDEVLAAGWWQVLLFIVTFAFFVLPIHKKINERLIGRRSHLTYYARTGKITDPTIQRIIDQATKALLIAWLILMAIALARKGWAFGAMFMPYLEGYKINPWSRGRVGGGISALLSLAGYVQIFLTAGFGVVAAVASNPKTRLVAITVCFLALPYYIFDRTRNPMIATIGPGLMAWVFLRLRGGFLVKGTVLLAAFLLANFWFMAVTRTDMDRGTSVGDALKQIKSNESKDSEESVGIDDGEEDLKHQGLSMFSELAYMGNMLDYGIYKPTWGGRYFAEAVNFIPRGLWKNKPLVGIDYAIARGFGDDRVKDDAGGGITATIATGMIGQGVVNFGRLFGPIAAALLMSIWVSILARLDLRGDIARLLLCGVGMILTFNMGRDITLFVLYPFVFGWMLIHAMEWYKSKYHVAKISAARESHRQAASR